MSMTKTKDPAARLDYQFVLGASTPPPGWRGTWPGPWLKPGEVITDADVSVNGTGLIIDGPPIVDDTTVTVWLAGGNAGRYGTTYEVTCHITTNQGREDDFTMRLVVRDR